MDKVRAHVKPSLLTRAAMALAVIGVFSHGTIAAAQFRSGWTAPVDISGGDAEGIDLYPVLLCDDYQNLHFLWGKSYEDGSAIYYRSDTGGLWSEPRAVLAVPDPFAVELSAAISEPDQVLHLIWQTSYTGGKLYYSQVPLFDSGNARAWSRPQILLSTQDVAAIEVDALGVVSIWYGSSDENYRQSQVFYIESRDGGAVWSAPIPVYSSTTPTASMILSIDPLIDEAGRIHLAVYIRSQSYGAYSELLYFRSTDGGQTWQQEVVAGPDTTSPGVAVLKLYASDRNTIHRTWHSPQRMHQLSPDGGASWSRPVEIMSLGNAFGGPNALAVDSAGVLHVVTAAAGGVYSAAFEGTKWTAPERIETRSMDPHDQAIAICQGNRLHVAYDDRFGQDTTVWYSSREINAPHIEQKPVPRPDLQPTTVVIGEIAVSAAPTPTHAMPRGNGLDAVASQPSPLASVGNPYALLLLPMGSTLLLVAGAFAFHMIRQRRK